MVIGTPDKIVRTASQQAIHGRLDITEVATQDRRHVTIVRPRHVPTPTAGHPVSNRSE